MNQVSNNNKECQFGTLCLNDPPEMGNCSTRYRVYKDRIRQLQHTKETDICVDYSHLFLRIVKNIALLCPLCIMAIKRAKHKEILAYHTIRWYYNKQY